MKFLKIFFNTRKDKRALREKFGDVKIVAMGGSRDRVETFAKYAHEQLHALFPNISKDDPTTDLAIKGGRYVMFKVGPILVIFVIPNF